MSIKKKLTSSIALLCLAAIMMVPAIASAEIKANRFSVSPFIGGAYIDEAYQADHGVMGGLRFGYDYTKNLGVEASYGYIATRFVNDDDDSYASGHAYRIDALYHFLPDSVIVPHLAAGLGGFSMIYEDEGRANFSMFAMDWGGGLSYFIKENFALRGDLRHVYMPADGNSNVEYSLGLTYYFGAPAPARAPEPEKDSDNDGVLDSKDRCPYTPKGDKVDAVGCTIVVDGDDDHDGVLNSKDRCPTTPKGDKVDAVGCTVDGDDDNDGVLNSRDKCPTTPRGDKVDAVGCTVDGDDDNDGVLNSRDKCPTTPKGDRVDAVGCTIKEKVSIKLLVEFDTDKSDIKPQFHDEIRRAADFMQKYPDATAVIEGHTDSVGNYVHNVNLSKRRAESVLNYLVEKFNISASRLKAEGYGPDRPVSSNATKEGRKENRRVVAVFEGMK